MNQIGLLLGMVAICVSQNCTPFGTRLQYGQQLIDASSSHKIAISFNTGSSCSSSFLRVLSN